MLRIQVSPAYLTGCSRVQVFMALVNAFAQPELIMHLKLTPAKAIRLYLQIITRGIYTQKGIRRKLSGDADKVDPSTIQSASERD